MLDVFKTLTDGILEKVKTFKGDWNENDSSSPNYIKNRTHWVETEEKTTYVLNNYSFESFDMEGIYGTEVPYACKSDPVIGETYTVIFDGKEYQCECKKFNMGRETVVEEDLPRTIGNLGIPGAGANTGEPFLVLFIIGEGLSLITKNIGDHTLTVYKNGIVEKVHKIDEKFLPEMSGYMTEEDHQIDLDEIYSNMNNVRNQVTSLESNSTTLFKLVGDKAVSEQINAAISNISQADWNINDTSDSRYIENRIAHYGTNQIVQKDGSIICVSMPGSLKTGSNDIYFHHYAKYNGQFTSVFQNANMLSIEMDDSEPLYLKRDIINYQPAIGLIDNLACFGNKSLFSDEYEDTGEFILILENDTNDQVGGVYTKGLYSGITPTIYKYQLEDMKKLDEIFIPDTIARMDDIPHTENIVGKHIVSSESGTSSSADSEALKPLHNLMFDQLTELVCVVGDTKISGVSKRYTSGAGVKYGYIGNLSLNNSSFPNTGESYLFVCYHNPSSTFKYQALVYLNNTLVTGNFTVRHPDTTVMHELDEKYIPDSIARKDYVDQTISNLIDSAPETLDTLNELAAALGDDANFAATVTNQIGQKADKTDLDNHYTKEQIDAMELITIADIDEICGITTMITFTIDGTEYQTEAGTTWYTWANANGWNCSSETDGVWDSNYDCRIADSNNTDVSGSDIIIAGAAYIAYN